MSTEEQAIRDRIEQVQQTVAGLQNDLDAVDGELESLSGQQQQYELLDRACGSLEELDRLGATTLFWGQAGDAGRGAEHVQAVRRRVTNFESRLAEIQKRRQAIVEKIDSENESISILDEDLADALAAEESRKAEWIIEREEGRIPYHAQVMPWMRGFEEDWRFRKSLAASMLVVMLLAVVTQIVELPLPERTELTEVPERVAKLIREERQMPAQPEPVIEEPVREQEEPEPEPMMAEETPPEPTPEAADEPAPQETRQARAREQAQSKGILAFRESFASRAESRPSAQLGSQARLGNAGDTAVGRPQRAMVTTTGAGSSGGINLGDISRNAGSGAGGQIGGVEVTRVASSIGSGSGGGANRPRSGGHSAGRTDEEIQIIFDRYKAALYRLYNRELRKDPTLRGQLVVRLTIEPDGSVSLCRLESSDMDAPTLAQQVVDRIRDFDFGAKEDVVAMTIIYPIDFLPAA